MTEPYEWDPEVNEMWKEMTDNIVSTKTDKPERKSIEDLQEEYKDVMNNLAVTESVCLYMHGGPGWREDQIEDFLKTRKTVTNKDLLASHIVCMRLGLTGEEALTLTKAELTEKYSKWPHEYEQAKSSLPDGPSLGVIIAPILKEMWDELMDAKNKYFGMHYKELAATVLELCRVVSIYDKFFNRVIKVIEAHQKETEKAISRKQQATKEMFEKMDKFGKEHGKEFGQMMRNLFDGKSDEPSS